MFLVLKVLGGVVVLILLVGANYYIFYPLDPNTHEDPYFLKSIICLMLKEACNTYQS